MLREKILYFSVLLFPPTTGKERYGTDCEQCFSEARDRRETAVRN